MKLNLIALICVCLIGLSTACDGEGADTDTATPADTTAPGDTATPADTAAPGDTATPADTTAPGDTNMAADTAEPPMKKTTLTEIFEPVFQGQGCTAGYCHGGAVDALKLSDIDNTHANLLNQPAVVSGCGATMLVVPGDPEKSVLWHRVKPLAEGEEPCVPKMPKGSMGLSEEHAKLVYDWILSGAEK